MVSALDCADGMIPNSRRASGGNGLVDGNGNDELRDCPISDNHHFGCDPRIIQIEVVMTIILKVFFGFNLEPKYINQLQSRISDPALHPRN